MHSPNDLSELLGYVPDTGDLVWLKKISRKVVVGRVAGTPNANGYLQVKIQGVQYKVHRVAWALHHGAWPERQIDHINGNRADNRITNLRLADQAQNLQNSARRSDNRSGHPGVSWYKKTRSWRADITVNGVTTYLGSFHDKREAITAYLEAKSRLHTFNPVPREAP